MAINTHNGDKRAYLLKPHGSYRNLTLDFKFGPEIEVFYSCSLQWKNQHYVFGGYKQPRQVSMVNGYRLERKGTLDFKIDAGGCTVLNEQTVVLCFDWRQTQVCYQSSNPLGKFTKPPNSHYTHWMTRIASFDGK